MSEVRLIDANALKNSIDSSYVTFGQCVYAKGIVDRQPTIEAEPVRHGRWDEIQCFSEHGVEMASYECTNCGNDIERQRGLVPQYCEFCGARMGKEDDEDAGSKTD